MLLKSSIVENKGKPMYRAMKSSMSYGRYVTDRERIGMIDGWGMAMAVPPISCGKICDNMI